jgi:hypothetical protein
MMALGGARDGGLFDRVRDVDWQPDGEVGPVIRAALD